MGASGIGVSNYGYSGSMPSGMDNNIRYQDQLEVQKINQYHDAMEAQQRQMAANRTIGAMSPRMYGHGSDELASRLYRRQSYLSSQSAIGGVTKGVTDLSSYQAASFGLSKVGGLAGFALPMVVANVAAKPIIRGIDNGMNNHRDAMGTAADFDVYRNSLGFKGGMSFQQSTAAGYAMRSEMGKSNFFSKGEMERIHKIGMSNGMLNSLGGADSGTMKQYKENFQKLSKTTEEIVKTMKTTIEGGMSVMKELQSAGFSGAGLQNQVKSIAASAKANGTSVQNVMSQAAQGAAAVQGTPWSTSTGASLYTHGMTQAHNMTNSASGARAVSRAGGAGQAGATIANALASQMSSGFGTKYAAYMMNNDGTLNRDRLEKVMSNEASAIDIVNGAGSRGAAMGPSGRVMFESNKQKMYDAMSPDEMSKVSRSMFDQWSIGRGGTKQARSMVWAKMWGSNSREVDLLHSYNMRAGSLDRTDAYKYINEAASVNSRVTSGPRRGLGGAIDAVSDFGEAVGEGMYDAMSSKSMQKKYAKAKKYMKYAGVGAGIGLAASARGAFALSAGGFAPLGASLAAVSTIGGAAAGMALAGAKEGTNGGWVGNILRKTGLADEYETFSTANYSDPTKGLEYAMGLSGNLATTRGAKVIQERGYGYVQSLNIKATQGDAAAGLKTLQGLGFQGASASSQAAIRAGLIQGSVSIGGMKNIVKDSNFLRSIGVKPGTKEAIAISNWSQKTIEDNIAGMDSHHRKAEERVAKAKGNYKAVVKDMSQSDITTAEKEGKRAYTRYEEVMGNSSLMSELGLKGNASFSKYQSALQSNGTGIGTVTTSKGAREYALLAEETKKANSGYGAGSTGVSLDRAQANLVSSINAGVNFGKTGGSFEDYRKAVVVSAGVGMAAGAVGGLGIVSAPMAVAGGVIGGVVGGVAAYGNSMNKRLGNKLNKFGIDIETDAGKLAYARAIKSGKGDVYNAALKNFKGNGGTDEGWNKYYKSVSDDIDAFDSTSYINKASRGLDTRDKQLAAKFKGNTAKSDAAAAAMKDLKLINSGKYKGTAKEMVMNNAAYYNENGFGDETSLNAFAGKASLSSLVAMEVNTPAAKKEERIYETVTKNIAIEKATNKLDEYVKKNTKESFWSGKKTVDDSIYDDPKYRELATAKEKALEDLVQVKDGGGTSARQTVINPPTVSYWNNNWAVR